MATRSTITVNINNVYRSIYCHWDGYPEYLGVMLVKYYESQYRAEQLVNMGSFSTIDQSLVGIPGGFNRYSKRKIEGYSENHARDMESPWAECAPWEGKTFADNMKNAAQEFNYLWEDGDWYVTPHNRPGTNPVPLSLHLVRTVLASPTSRDTQKKIWEEVPCLD